MMGFTSFFDNFLTIIILLVAWLVVVIAFFILAVQMFVTILEFKLTTLAGFILVPFAFWNRTSFLAERVLGNVVGSGIKVMVLAVIVGIGSNYFTQFATALQGHEPDVGQAMSLVLASLSLFGLGIFGPGIASALVAGAPQLGAGAAVGTMLGAGGIMYLGGAGAMSAARSVAGGGLSAIRAGASMGGAASAAYGLGQQSAGSSSIAAGLSGIGRAASNAVNSSVASTIGFGEAVQSGGSAARAAFAGAASPSPSGRDAAQMGMPEWARDMKAAQANRHHGQAAIHTIQQGDRGGAGAPPDIQERDD
jgi:type IV secretion system protein TrbL